MPHDLDPEDTETATCRTCLKTLPIWFFYDYRERGGAIYLKCRACIRGVPHSSIKKSGIRYYSKRSGPPPAETKCRKCGSTFPSEYGKRTCTSCTYAKASALRRKHTHKAKQMAETRLLAELGLKHCDTCKKDLDIKLFPTLHGKPHGRYCRKCASQRSGAFHKLRQARNPPKTRGGHCRQPLTKIDLRPFTERQLETAVALVFRAIGLRRCKCGTYRDGLHPGTYKHWKCNPCERKKLVTESDEAKNRRLEYAKLWKKKNPERRRAQSRKSKTKRAMILKKAYVGEDFTLQEIAERDRNRCWICGKHVSPKDRSVDHVHPISRGGKHSRANVKLAHQICNARKQDDLPLIALSRLAPQKSNPA